jgi:hypothetical protein
MEAEFLSNPASISKAWLKEMRTKDLKRRFAHYFFEILSSERNWKE